MDYFSHHFFSDPQKNPWVIAFGDLSKASQKVYHLKGHFKRSRMALVSASYNFPVTRIKTAKFVPYKCTCMVRVVTHASALGNVLKWKVL